MGVFVHRNDTQFPHELKFAPESRAWFLKGSQLGENHLVIFRVTKKNRDNVGEVGIVLQGHIESTDHIKNTIEDTTVKKKKSPKNDNHASPAASSMEPSVPGSSSAQCPPTESKKKRKSNADANIAASVGIEPGPSH